MKKIKSKSFFIYSSIMHLLFSVVVVLLSWQIFEPNLYNYMVSSYTARTTGSDEIVEIVIDDKSVSYHRWPWQRELYGKVFEYLNSYARPKVIGYDAIVSSVDRENPASDKKFFDTLKPLTI